MTPAEGSDLDRVVRPLGRGREGVLHVVIHRSSALRALTCAYLTRTPQPGSFPIDTPMDALRQDLLETVARRRSATLLSEFGLGHVREYTPFGLWGLGALRAPCPNPQTLHLILRAAFSSRLLL